MPSLPTAAVAGLSRVGTRAAAAAPKAAATTMRTVGVSRITPAVANKAATQIAALPPTQKKKLADMLTRKNVTLGGVVVGTSIAAGIGIDELAEMISAASPDEMLNFLEAVDSVDQNAGTAVAEAHNEIVTFSQLDRDYSDERSNDGFVAQAQVSGLGLDRERIEQEQRIARQYSELRRKLTVEDILTLQFLVHHAKPEDIAALEDMRVFRA